jgi:hypothetical protein
LIVLHMIVFWEWLYTHHVFEIVFGVWCILQASLQFIISLAYSNDINQIRNVQYFF